MEKKNPPKPIMSHSGYSFPSCLLLVTHRGFWHAVHLPNCDVILDAMTTLSARYGSDLNSGSWFLGLRFLWLIWSSLSITPLTSQGAATACSQLPSSSLNSGKN